MATWNISVQSVDYIPDLSFLTPEFARRLSDPQDGIELTDVEGLVAYNHLLNLSLAIEAESSREARERAIDWVERVCKGATEWRSQSEVVFDDEVDDDYEGETHEIAQFFVITGVVDAETGEEAAA